MDRVWLVLGKMYISDRLADLNAELDAAADLLLEGDGNGAIMMAVQALSYMKASTARADWMTNVIPFARAHRFASIVRRDPITDRSISKPRGYPGDAVLMDLIYRHSDVAWLVERLDHLGRVVYDFTSDVSACVAVRERRRFLAGQIDETAMARDGVARVFSLACGHLRELELSAAFAAGGIEVLGVDQDAAALTTALRLGVTTRQLSAASLIRDSRSFGTFDLVYAAGLFDYLGRRISLALATTLFSMTAPGGRLIIPNFLPDIWETPYLEAFMDWSLLYRTQAEIEEFASGLDTTQIDNIEFSRDATGHIGYLEIAKR